MKNKNFIISILIGLLFSFFPQNLKAEEQEPRNLHFAWGAELGASLDMSSHNMSAIGINAKFGMRWKWIRFLGVGIQGDMMVSNSAHTYPLYLNFRTDFANTNQLIFMDLRGGVAFNNLYESKYTAPYLSGGVGVTLAKGKTFSSHIILAYSYLGQDVCYDGLKARNCPGISFATMRLGVAF